MRKRVVTLLVPGLVALSVSVLLNAQGSGVTPVRQGQAVLTLSNGRMLITGGLNGLVPTADAALVDPASGTSFELAPMGEARAYHTMSAMPDGRVLVAGGRTLEIFDPASNSFLEAGVLSPARSAQAAAVMADGRVLLAGGFAANGVPLARIDIFDPGTGSVARAGAALAVARGYLSATTLPSGDVLLAGGNDGANDLTATDIYHPLNDSASRGPALAISRSGQEALLSPDGQTVLLRGGRSEGSTNVQNELIRVDGLLSGRGPRATGSTAGGAGTRTGTASAGTGTTVRFSDSTLLASPNVSSSTGTNEAANLDQCRNGTLTSPVRCVGSAWVNGNAGASNAHWLEGDSIAYRVRFSNLDTSGGNSHTLTIQWDTTQSGKHAIDYITSFNRTATDADPCDGNTTCDSTTLATFAIPADPNTALGTSLADGRWNQLFSMYGATITSLSAYSLTGTYASSSSTAISITFTTTTANPVLAWGGHIATRKDWGTFNSAVAINGSPYHTRLLGLDGASTGNQDRSLSTAAVIFPAILTVHKDVQTATGGALTVNDSFSYNTTTDPSLNGSPEIPASFSLKDDGVDPNYVSYNLVLFGSANQVVFSEVNPTPLYAFYSLSCQVADGGLGTTGANANTSGAQATVVPQEAVLIDCYYVNRLQNGTLVVKKHVVNDNGGTLTASSFTLHVSSGGNDVSGSPAVGSETGTSYSLMPGSYVVSENTPPSTYTESGPACTSLTGASTISGGNVTLAGGDTVTCTITNNDNIANPTVNTTPTLVALDSMTLTGLRGGLSSTVTFSLFAPADTTCSATPIFTVTKTIASTESGNVTVTTTDNHAGTPSGSSTISAAGTYRWLVSFSGNANNAAVAGSCGAEYVTITAVVAQ